MSEFRDKLSPAKRLSRTCVKLNCIKERLAVENSPLADRLISMLHKVKECADEKFAIDNESPAEGRSSKVEMKSCAGEETALKINSPAKLEGSKGQLGSCRYKRECDEKKVSPAKRVSSEF